MTTKQIKEIENSSLLPTYNRPNFVISHGKGVYLYDTDGKQYLDFIAGIAVNALGHADAGILAVLKQQGEKLWHCSNLYSTEPQARLAKLLTDLTCTDKVFFGNSGTEAVEGAIKFARKWAKEEKGIKSPEIIAFHNSFHGRSMGALSATGQSHLWQGFEPMLPGFRFADFNHLASATRLITKNTCAIIFEPIQGEGGIYPAENDFVAGLRALCDKHNILLIADEIQCGVGRTGTFSACEHFDIEPDIITLAKPLANGLPLGAILLNEKVAGAIKPGDHGSTFGGGPLITSVAEHVVSRIAHPDFLRHVNEMSDYLMTALKELQKAFPLIKSVRGIGLMIGIELDRDPKEIINACIESGLLVVKTSGNTFRFLPPLIVERKHIDEAIEKLAGALSGVAKS